MALPTHACSITELGRRCERTPSSDLAPGWMTLRGAGGERYRICPFHRGITTTADLTPSADIPPLRKAMNAGYPHPGATATGGGALIPESLGGARKPSKKERERAAKRREERRGGAR